LLKSSFTAEKGLNVLGMLAQFIEHALAVLPNMLVVLAAALSATIAVSFFHGHVVTIKTFYLVTIMFTGTVSLLLGLAGGITYVVLAHRRREFDQRELATLFSLLLFALGASFGLIPGISEVPTIAEGQR
jgi:hypothetical protein